MNGKRRSEVEVARDVIAYFRDLRWDVFQEVQIGHSQARPDIVATLGNLVAIVEVKCSLSLSVMAQAENWVRRGRAHFVWVAAPCAARTTGSELAERVCEMVGAGCLGVPENGNVWVKRQAPLHRRAKTEWTKLLCDEHRTFAEAGSSGGYWSPFKATCRRVVRFASEHPEGAPLRALVSGIEHHYASAASARNSLREWIRAGHLEGVELRIEKGKALVYPSAKAAEASA